MAGYRYNIRLIIALVSLFPLQAFSQQVNAGNSIIEDNPGKVILKPRVYYMFGSNFSVVPHLGSVSALTLSSVLSIPLSPKLSVEGGIMASYYYSAPLKSDNGGFPYGSFSGLSVYGSASYQFNPQLSLYGSAIKQIAGSSPFYSIPKSSYTIGSSYNFGNFSIGVSLQMSNWDNIYSPFQTYSPPGYYSPFGQSRISR
jgi:hypothetical protein